MSNVERRMHLPATTGPLELRASADDSGPGRVEGYTAVFDSDSVDLGGFIETIAPGAFGEAIRVSDVRALFNHSADAVLGRSTSGTLKLKEDRRGLHFSVQLPNTATGRDVAEMVRRGDVTGASFKFTVAPGGEEWTRDEGIERRRITKVGQLFDVGPVTYPAYQATEVSARALEMARKGPSGVVPRSDAWYRERAEKRHRELVLDGIIQEQRDEARKLKAETTRGTDEWYRAQARERAASIAAQDRRARRIERLQAKQNGTDAWHHRLAAFHEAGHAVIGHQQGVRVERLILDRDEPGAGECHVRDDFKTVQYLLGGVAAVKLAAERGELAAPVDPWGGARGDTEKAREILGGSFIGDARLRTVVRETEPILLQRWAAVTAVADRLFDKGSMDSGEVEETIRTALFPSAAA